MRERQAAREVALTLAGSEETLRFGKIGGEVAKRGLVLCLDGPLGAGKTTLVSGIAQGLGLPEVAQSPTFTLIAEYPEGRLPLYHMDLYRLGEEAPQTLDLFDEYIYGDGVCAIEWARWIAAHLPDDRLEIAIASGSQDPGARFFKLNAMGNLAMEVLDEWINRWSI